MRTEEKQRLNEEEQLKQILYQATMQAKFEAVAKEGIRPIAFRHERGAVMAADGYARVSDRQNIGVVAMFVPFCILNLRLMAVPCSTRNG